MSYHHPDRKLCLAFFWHMHQPYYKDDATGQIMMPWVFLHAIKDYYEIPWYMSRYEGIKATYNLVPSLITQLQEYTDINVKDRFLQSVRKRVDELSYDEKKYLLLNLFHANPETMIKPFERYFALYQYKNKLHSLQEQMDYFGPEELLDLEVLFLLCWCGNYLRENDTAVIRLVRKGAHYSEEDKQDLLESLCGFVGEIVPFYRKLKDSGRIALSTTPFYHPILPLITDMQNGKAANALTAIPPKVKRDFRNDADLHVSLAVDFHTSLFGEKPTGFWPAEGSVSNEALEILADHGGRWACTDEEIIFKTKKSGDRSLVYKKYYLEHYGRSIGMLFRDKFLSDRLGFVYGHHHADAAVDDFVKHLESIYLSHEHSTVVPVILDGENAWEHYVNNGKDFFDALYHRLQLLPWCETVTMDEVFANDSIPSDSISTIEPGSWINGDFGIWLGEPEENLAWEYLHETKKAFDSKKQDLAPDVILKVQKELMIAEGSDWFWWYGNDHYTPVKDEFDALFRKHLINAYALMGEEVPTRLSRPIIQKTHGKERRYSPIAPISPVIDGQYTDFFEWHGSGFCELAQQFSTMNTSAFRLKELRYGFDQKNLYLAISGEFEEVRQEGYELDIEMLYPDKRHFSLPLQKECVNTGGIKMCLDEICEIQIPFKLLGKDAKRAEFVFALRKGEEVIERAPLYSVIEIGLDSDVTTEWYV